MNFVQAHSDCLPSSSFIWRSDPKGNCYHGAPRGSIVCLFVRLHLTLITQGKNDGFRLSTQDRPATTLWAPQTEGVQHSKLRRDDEMTPWRWASTSRRFEGSYLRNVQNIKPHLTVTSHDSTVILLTTAWFQKLIRFSNCDMKIRDRTSSFREGWRCRVTSFGLWHRVDWQVVTNISGKYTASIFRAEHGC